MRKKKLFNFLPDMEMIEVKSEEFKNSSYRLKDSSNHFGDPSLLENRLIGHGSSLEWEFFFLIEYCFTLSFEYFGWEFMLSCIFNSLSIKSDR